MRCGVCDGAHHRLQERGTRFVCRWDASGAEAPRHSHHEKSWLVDVGHDSEVSPACVGGGGGRAFLDPSSRRLCTALSDGVHRWDGGEQRHGDRHKAPHECASELSRHQHGDHGSSGNRLGSFGVVLLGFVWGFGVDVGAWRACLPDPNVPHVCDPPHPQHHNFVQRWNEAKGAEEEGGCWPSLEAASRLPFPRRRSRAAADGGARVQMLRTLQAGRYTDTTPAPDTPPGFDVSKGEASIFEAYRNAFREAREFIYCENQHLAHPELIDLMSEAAARGVRVVYVAPRSPMSAVRHCAAALAKWKKACDALPEGSAAPVKPPCACVPRRAT